MHKNDITFSDKFSFHNYYEFDYLCLYNIYCLKIWFWSVFFLYFFDLCVPGLTFYCDYTFHLKYPLEGDSKMAARGRKQKACLLK
jgi:hypothetical protein